MRAQYNPFQWLKPGYHLTNVSERTNIIRVNEWISTREGCHGGVRGQNWILENGHPDDMRSSRVNSRKI